MTLRPCRPLPSLCRGRAPSSGRTVEIRATPPDGDLGETACTLPRQARSQNPNEVCCVDDGSQGPLELEVENKGEMAESGVPTPASVGPTTVVVSKPQGKEVCTFHAGKLTTRLYGSKTLARPLCKAFRKILPDRNSTTSRA